MTEDDYPDPIIDEVHIEGDPKVEARIMVPICEDPLYRVIFNVVTHYHLGGPAESSDDVLNMHKLVVDDYDKSIRLGLERVGEVQGDREDLERIWREVWEAVEEGPV